MPIPLALSTVATIAMCTPEPVTAELKPTTHLKKQAYFAGGLVPFCTSKLTVVD